MPQNPSWPPETTHVTIQNHIKKPLIGSPSRGIPSHRHPWLRWFGANPTSSCKWVIFHITITTRYRPLEKHHIWTKTKALYNQYKSTVNTIHNNDKPLISPYKTSQKQILQKLPSHLLAARACRPRLKARAAGPGVVIRMGVSTNGGTLKWFVYTGTSH